MSTVVYQNLVSCFETQFKETATTVKLKFAADMSTGLEYGNWALLQTYPKEPVEKTSFSTHYSSSFSRLSERSLELCTENLGSESGSDVSFYSSSSSFSHSSLIQDSSSCSRFEVEKPKQQEEKYSAITRKEVRNTTKRSDNLPPPLTSMCGPSSLQMRRRREGGRLIIDAVEAPFRNSYLQAERCGGRLRICFLTASDSTDTTTSAIEDEEEEEEEEEQQQQHKSENECGDEQAELKETDELRIEIESEMEELEGEMNYEVELEKFQRFSRCKEGGHGSKGLCWKPAFCVAT